MYGDFNNGYKCQNSGSVLFDKKKLFYWQNDIVYRAAANNLQTKVEVCCWQNIVTNESM